MLLRAGIHSAEDLLKYRPFRYEDRTNLTTIGALKPNQEAVVQGEVISTGRHTTRVKRIQIFEMGVEDETGSLQVKFFNQPYLEKVFHKGQRVIVYGLPKLDAYGSGLSMVGPEFEIIQGGSDWTVHTGRIVPVYRKIGQLSARAIRQLIFQLLEELPDPLEDPLPVSILEKYGFPARKQAFKEVHFPEGGSGAATSAHLKELDSSQTAAHQRFAFEEFFLFQLGLHITRKQRQVVPKERVIQINDSVRDVVKSILPFHPTSAQKRVLREIVDDLSSPKTMNRLLQGDVGSGKTIVAVQAMVVVAENGCQAVLMAPTEILSRQHYTTIRQYLNDTRYRIALLTGGVKGRQRTSLLKDVADGKIDILIGTHAVIQEGVEFAGLGLVVIDEQHRFGVLQRSRLMAKGSSPDTLVMTATPIPRSLALTVYGDLDISVLDEMPPGREPVRTLLRTEAERQSVYQQIALELAKGRQAFVIYPLIEESEKLDLRAATVMAEHLQRDVFTEHSVGLMHGRLKGDEREALMQRFKGGEIQVLVSTTVVEVGIDVPNATVTVIEHAERFGLSQLHQLRGRIGRGKHRGLCVLMVGTRRSREAYQRLETMLHTSDGFKIAEKDLEIRGPGEFVGTRQSGVPEFLFGNIVRDRQLLELARQEADGYLELCLKEASGPGSHVLSDFAKWWQQRYGLYDVG